MTRNDAAFRLALRIFAFHGAALRHDCHARVAETALAHWANTHALSLTRATRSPHADAKALRRHLRAGRQLRRRRDCLLPTLAATAAVSRLAQRAKLAVACRFVDDPRAVALLDSLARDLRRR